MGMIGRLYVYVPLSPGVFCVIRSIAIRTVCYLLPQGWCYPQLPSHDILTVHIYMVLLLEGGLVPVMPNAINKELGHQYMYVAVTRPNHYGSESPSIAINPGSAGGGGGGNSLLLSIGINIPYFLVLYDPGIYCNVKWWDFQDLKPLTRTDKSVDFVCMRELAVGAGS